MILGILMGNLLASAQQGIYIPKQGKIYFAGDTATIFSNVINQGNFGIDKKATLNFKGQTWQNDQHSLITDETSNGTGVAGQGGAVRFMADTGRQRLIGGYNVVTNSGPVFSNLHLLNSLGVELAESSAKVWQEMKFVRGHFYLNNHIFVVGHQQPGKLTGYDSTRFFVTGTQPGGSLLVRENITSGNGLVVFPVGTTESAYTPAAIRSKTTRGDDYQVTLFEGVRTNVLTGNSLAEQGVNKTWQMGKRYYHGQDEVEIVLQHLNKDEGTSFAQNRNKSYIAQFNNNQWDESIPQMLPANGNLTTNTPQANSGVNTRTLIAALSGVSYFSKFTGKSEKTLKTNIIFGAYRVGAYIVRVNWQTKPEINVKKFVVERRRTNEPSFVSIDTVASLAANGYSTNYLNYGINDSNSYKGVTFYQLKVFDYNDSTYYLPMVAVRGVSLDVEIGLWPNPTTDKFTIIVSGNVAEQVVIHNSLGQLVWKEEVKGRNVMEIKGHHFAQGVYYVTVIGLNRLKLRTEKLLIIR
jgi:hypothetical protein